MNSVNEAENYLNILLYLLSRLNEVINIEQQQFKLKTTLSEGRSYLGEHSNPPPLSPDSLSIGK